jgi:hypothetical protein
MVRRQAAFHSALVMCVAASQKPMQSCNVFPPPPGALGAAELDPPGDRAKLLWVVPPVENCVGSCGEGWATPGTDWLGGSRAEGEVDGVMVVTGARVRVPLLGLPGLVRMGPD